MNVNKISDVSTHVALHDGRQARRRAHQAIDNPRLPADFGGEPAELVGDLRAEHGEHENPQQPAPFMQRAVAEIQKSQRRNRDHREADAHHAVKKQERRFDRRTVFAAERRPGRSPSFCVSKPTRKLNMPRPLQADDLFVFLVHITDERQRRVGSRFRKVLQTPRVWPVDFSPRFARAAVAADQLQQRSDQRDGQADPQRCARKIQVPFLQQIPRADAHDEKRARLPRAAQHVKQPVHRWTD